jgi:hypothetical protein
MGQDYDSPLGGFSPSSPNYRPLSPQPAPHAAGGGAAGPTQPGYSAYGSNYEPNYGSPPGYASPPSQGNYGYYGNYAPPRRKSFTPVVVEVLLAIFGIYGVGWLMIGETTTGLLLLLAGFLWASVVVGGSAATAFTGACCLIPLHALFIVLSASQLSNRIKRMP